MFWNSCIVNTKFKSKTFNQFNWFLPLSTQGLCLISLALNVNFLSHLGWLSTSIKSCLVPALFVCVSVCVLINKPPPEKHHQKSSHVHPWMEETLQVWEWGEGWKSLLEVVALPQPREVTVGRGRILKPAQVLCDKRVCFSVSVVFRGSWRGNFFRPTPSWNPLGMQRQWKMTTPPALWVLLSSQGL